MIRYSAPNDQHDDIAMGLVIGWHAGFAGIRTLGLVEYVKQANAQGMSIDSEPQTLEQRRAQDMLRLEASSMRKVAHSPLIKPMLADETPHCEKCNSVCLVRIGAQVRCNSCGHSIDNSVTSKPPTRGDYLMKAS